MNVKSRSLGIYKSICGISDYVFAMKHVQPKDLESISNLLQVISHIKGIKVRQPGHFYYRGRNVLHFHEHMGVIYADIGKMRIKVEDSTKEKIFNEVKRYMAEIEIAKPSRNSARK